LKRFDIILMLSLALVISFVLAGCDSGVASDTTPTPVVTRAVTPKPTPKPTPTPSVKQKIENAIQNDEGAVTFCYIVDTKTSMVEVTGQIVTITENASQAPSGVDSDRAKECIFYVEKDAWTSGTALTSVTVHVEVLLQDQYGKQFIGDLARATLNKDTEQKFVWENLDYNSAWAVYDSTYQLPGAS